MREKIESALDQIRPALQRDGGNVELVDVSEDGKTVSVKLTGHCAGCPMAQMTLKMGIEKTLKEQIPEIEEVIAVNDNITTENTEG
ncbi:NifU family protein [Planctomycetota bacterium]